MLKVPSLLTSKHTEMDVATAWLEEYSDLPADAVLSVSPVHRLVREWRSFIVNGEVVAISQYKHHGLLCYREPVAPHTWEVAIQMSRKWLPAPNIVMDFCLTDYGEYSVVEFNSLVSSGFYNADLAAIVDALETTFKAPPAPWRLVPGVEIVNDRYGFGLVPNLSDEVSSESPS